MAESLTKLVQGTGRKLSGRTKYVTSAGTGGSGTWTDATNLAAHGADWYNHMWLYHNGDSKQWRITDDDGAGVLTLDPTTTPGNSSDYEILPVRPDLIVDAINQAAEELSYRLGRTVVDNSYVTDSPLFNAGFEDTTSSSAITGWQASSATLARESTPNLKLGGAYSAKVSGTAGYIEPTDEFQEWLIDTQGSTITVYFPCKSDTASSARLRLVIDGTTTDGDYHSGNSGWETLSVEAIVPDPVDTITVRLMHDDGSATEYWDNGWIEGGNRIYTYRMPASMPNGPDFIRLQSIGDRDLRMQHAHTRLWVGWQTVREEDPGVNVTRVNLHALKPPSFGRWFMVGHGPLTELSSRTDVAEIDRDRAELIETRAAIIVLEQIGTNEADKRRRELKERESELMDRIPERLGAAQFGVGSSGRGAFGNPNDSFRRRVR